MISHDVRAEPLDQAATLQLLATKNEFYEKKGKQVKHLQRDQDTIDESRLLKMFLGRSGTLRAPVLSAGPWIIAGFDEQTYRNLLEMPDQ